MRHTEFSLKRPVAISMIYIALAIVGAIGSRLLPLEYFPDIQFPIIFVQVPYPGSTPEEVERQITRPLEETLATLSGIEQMRSESREEMSQVELYFNWDHDTSAAGIDARAKIEALRSELPDDVRRILTFTGSTSDQPILVLRISSERDLSDSYDLLDRLLKRRIARIEGVSKVELQGVEPREIRIQIDADRLAAHNVDIAALLNLLERSNFSVSAGRITDSGRRFSVRPRGEYGSLDEIRNLVIDNGNLRLSDVATIEMRAPDRDYGRHLDGTYAIGLQVFKETGANMVSVGDMVMDEVEAVAKLPQMQGIRIFDLDNDAAGVRKSLNDLRNAGLLGGLLAIFVLYLFLRQMSTTLIVTLSVPFSLLITLAVMYFAGLSINILSMMGLMLAIGMLVDNSVVVTESVFRYRQLEPDKPYEATVKGAKEVSLAIITGTATSVIVFVPIMFGTKADITVFLTHVAVTISVAMIASLIIAQTLIPMLASRIAPPKPAKEGAWMQRLTDRYVNGLAWTLRHPWWAALGIVLIIASVAIPISLIKFDAWPQESKRRLFMLYHIEGSHPVEQTEAAVNRIEDYLFANQEELDIVSIYSYFDTIQGQTSILLTEEDVAKKSTRDIIKQIEEELPKIAIGKPSFQFDQQGGGEGFSLQVSGDSTEQLSPLSRDLARVLENVEGLEDVRTNASEAEFEVQVIVDRERASRLGMSTESVANAVATAMRGRPLREFRGGDSEIDMRLTFRESDKQTVEDLMGLPLYAATGERVTLGSVARFHVQRGQQMIRRVDRKTAVVIEANLAEDTSMEDVKPRVEALMEQFSMPPGYSWKFGRGFDRNDETQQIMAQNILLGIALIFIVMAALFESVLFPLAIITSIGFSVIGVFWFFLLTGTTFSFMASIGIMILIGVVVNNGIVLVDHINNLRREGMPRYEAMLQAGRDRLRPILMTVMTTILGLTPLAVGSTHLGGDGPPYYPMARAIIGGLAFSTVTSLFIVPYLYELFDNLSRWGRKVMSTARRALVAAET